MQADSTMGHLDVNAALAKPEPVSIPLGVAVLCADCGRIHNQISGTCPCCTSRHGIPVERIVNRRAA